MAGCYTYNKTLPNIISAIEIKLKNCSISFTVYLFKQFILSIYLMHRKQICM